MGLLPPLMSHQGKTNDAFRYCTHIAVAMETHLAAKKPWPFPICLESSQWHINFNIWKQKKKGINVTFSTIFMQQPAQCE